MTERAIDEAIAQYSQELAAEASLAKGDLAEIEDHLRSLIDELRAHQPHQPLAQAIAQAKQRLGQPRALAREHARVHGSFGPPLSRLRAWSAVALLVPMLIDGAVHLDVYAYSARLIFELLAGAGLAIGLVAGRGWARPVLFAGALFWSVPMLVSFAIYGLNPVWLACHLGIAAFLAPWRWREVTRASVALSLQIWALGAAMMVLSYQITTKLGETVYVTPAAQLAFGAAVLATIGGIVRARWSALASVVVAGTLAVAMQQLSGIGWLFEHALAYELLTKGLLVTGVVASLVSTVLLWRHARSALGSLREAFAR